MRLAVTDIGAPVWRSTSFNLLTMKRSRLSVVRHFSSPGRGGLAFVVLSIDGFPSYIGVRFILDTDHANPNLMESQHHEVGKTNFMNS
jgi:hypothetical protein